MQQQHWRDGIGEAADKSHIKGGVSCAKVLNCQLHKPRFTDDNDYCKSTNFSVLLYLANLANCVFSLICRVNIRKLR